MISKLPYYGLGIYLITGIFYIFPSGMPQPADFFLLLTIITGFVLWQRVPSATMLYLTVAVLCLWIYAVNAVAYATFGDLTFLRKTAFYIYNSAVLVFVLVAAYRDWRTLCIVVRWACIIALFAQFLHVLLVPAYTISGVRAVGTFHNPNQLGYWALLAMALLATSKDGKPINAIDLAAIAAGGYAILLSLSKAALASGIVMILLILAFQRVRRGWLMATAAVGVLLIGQLQTHGPLEAIANLELTGKIEHRVTTAQEDDNILNRGYKVIWENPQYWAVGAGEGQYVERFVPSPKNSEVHSSLGNILFSYGLVGLGIFLFLLWLVFSRASWASCLYIVPIMAYSMVHMGLRVSEFWIFLAMAYAQTRWGNSYQDTVRTAKVTFDSYQDTTRTAKVTRVSSSEGMRHEIPAHSGGVPPEHDLGQRRDDHPERRSGIRDGGGEGRGPVPGGRDVQGVCRAGPYGREYWCDRS